MADPWREGNPPNTNQDNFEDYWSETDSRTFHAQPSQATATQGVWDCTQRCDVVSTPHHSVEHFFCHFLFFNFFLQSIFIEVSIT
jgi:hypothetical protein